IIHYSTVGNVSVKKIVCNYYDDRDIYFGLNGRMGIVKYDARLDSFIAFNNQKENPLSQFPNAVNCINFFNDSLLLAGTFGNGLFIYNTRNNSMTGIGSSDGLYSDYVFNVIPIDKKSVFVSTSGGVSVYDFETESVYSITDYVSQRDRDYVNTGIQDAHGNIYCYALNSFIRFHPRDFIINKQKPEVVINRMKVMMRDADSLLSKKNIRLSYEDNSLAFGFSALTFTNPGKTEFAYKLEGLDEDWNYSNSNNFVSYAHLRPGNYVFRVKAANSDTVWNESGDSIAIFIAAPYWQTAWFRILIIAFIAGALFTIYRYQLHKKIEKLKAVEFERKRISADLHDDLGSTLTKISLMSQVAANIAGDRQQETLRKISEDSSDMVDKMNGIIWALNTENDTLPNLIAYIRKQAYAMFEDSTINLTMNISELVEEIPVSGEVRRNIFLVVKEALHNVLKYSQATEVSLSMEMHSGALNISISDNGRGFVLNGKPTGGGTGIANMKKRMKESGSTVEITSSIGNGTSVLLKCPMHDYTKV
ncbi:MAG: hypothetical protein JJE25_08295, partial [Bacteroidia bacterium]|nr:hypothetical protein [Bacteroidia bacterium]